MLPNESRKREMRAQREKLIQELETSRNSKVLLFFTGDRRNLETRIASDVYDLFVNHLDKIGVVKKLSLFLYTRGGDTLAAWSLVNLIRQGGKNERETERQKKEGDNYATCSPLGTWGGFPDQEPDSDACTEAAFAPSY